MLSFVAVGSVPYAESNVTVFVVLPDTFPPFPLNDTVYVNGVFLLLIKIVKLALETEMLTNLT